MSEPQMEAIDYALYDIRGDVHGFEFLSVIHSRLSSIKPSLIRFDMKDVSWIDSHICSAFLSVIRSLQDYGHKIIYINSSEKILSIMNKNGFYKSKSILKSNTVIPLREFLQDESLEFSHYVKTNFRRMHFPQMTDRLREKIFEGLDEIFNNCCIHSRAQTKIVVCGQFYPRREQFDFSITDRGIGIKGAYNLAFPQPVSGEQAIDWAMREGSTTRQGDIPGGLGLKILRNFIHLNGGRFIVASRDGFWSEWKGRSQANRISTEFPGTCVTIEVSTSDKSYYELSEVPKPTDIW